MNAALKHLLEKMYVLGCWKVAGQNGMPSQILPKNNVIIIFTIIIIKVAGLNVSKFVFGSIEMRFHLAKISGVFKFTGGFSGSGEGCRLVGRCVDICRKPHPFLTGPTIPGAGNRVNTSLVPQLVSVAGPFFPLCFPSAAFPPRCPPWSPRATLCEFRLLPFCLIVFSHLAFLCTSWATGFSLLPLEVAAVTLRVTSGLALAASPLAELQSLHLKGAPSPNRSPCELMLFEPRLS